jgi:hypothetical protein
MDIMELLIDFYKDLERLGPGSDEQSKKHWKKYIWKIIRQKSWILARARWLFHRLKDGGAHFFRAGRFDVG